ncbi:MAG: hypothetical protein M0Q38_06900 [Bacteroidales bacterium]|jgi:hypothetical protein|nr:hypothetical protein [Bacteroidales bacterium]
MNQTLKSVLIWVFAVVFTIATAIYQRMTGPTYPVRGKVEIGQQKIAFRLIRTYDGMDDARVIIVVPDTSIKGEIVFRRFKSFDKWNTNLLERHGDTLLGYLPHQAPAGKIMYQVTLIKGDQRFLLNNEPAILRYKGFVPGYVIIPHIFFIFLAMLFSTLTGVMAIFKGKNTYIYAWITVITLTLGGMLLGPVVQKFSFGVYWSGWPFGYDLTDNKSLIAFIFWVIALVVMTRHRDNRMWAIIASIAMFIIFMIPHSVLGSEIDFTKQQKIETTK